MRRARQTAQGIAKETGSVLQFGERLVEKGYYRTEERYADGTFKFAKIDQEVKKQKLST